MIIRVATEWHFLLVCIIYKLYLPVLDALFSLACTHLYSLAYAHYRSVLTNLKSKV